MPFAHLSGVEVAARIIHGGSSTEVDVTASSLTRSLAASLLFFGDDVLISSQGTQQGDPLGDLFFALGLYTRVDEQAKLRLCLVFYMMVAWTVPLFTFIRPSKSCVQSCSSSCRSQFKLVKCKSIFREASESNCRIDALDIDGGAC